MIDVFVSRIHFPVTTLGPGQRIGIWFQGCSIRCEGCISADTWKSGIGGTDTDEVMMALTKWLPRSDGITISGGEPFDQPEALQRLLIQLRSSTRGDILVYSGYPFEALETYLLSMPGLIDALITDPYDQTASQTKSLRGSDNQRLHYLTALGEQRFSAYLRKPFDRRVDLMVDPSGEIWMAGIPGRGDFERLAGATSSLRILKTSQDTSIRKGDSQ